MGHFRVDNIAISGSVVPGPSTYALLLRAVAFGIVCKRRNFIKIKK
jgi:hypothetical protein